MLSFYERSVGVPDVLEQLVAYMLLTWHNEEKFDNYWYDKYTWMDLILTLFDAVQATIGIPSYVIQRFQF